MLADALKYLVALGQTTSKTEKIATGNPKQIAYVIGGQVKVFDTPPEPREHVAETLDDFAHIVNRFHAKGANVAVWYGFGRAIAILDDDGHRLSRVDYTCGISQKWNAVRALEQGPGWLDHRDFLRLLKITLAGTGTHSLVDKARKLKFTTGQVTTVESARQRESLGREITSQVKSDAGELPEEIALEVPLYCAPADTSPYVVRLSLEVDSDLGKFRLRPLPDEIARVEQLGAASIGVFLQGGIDDMIPIHQGSESA